MATGVGTAGYVSTWGKFRCVWCLQENYDFPTFSDYNITYGSGQKASASGSGLIRYRPRPLTPFFSDELQPTIWNQAYTDSFPPPIGGNRIYSQPQVFSASSPTGVESEAVTDEAKAVMTGATVDFLDGRSTTITSALWDTGRQTWDGPGPSPTIAGDVVAIGNLTAF
jgi:hypothetical protein